MADKVRWRIDAAHIVHVPYCPVAEEAHALPYHPLVPGASPQDPASTPTTHAEMHAHAARPDLKDKMPGVTVISICPTCIEPAEGS